MLPLRLWLYWTSLSFITILIFIVISVTGESHWWSSSFFGYQYENNYCEDVETDNFLRQKANTISNLPFILIGELLIFIYINDKRVLNNTDEMDINDSINNTNIATDTNIEIVTTKNNDGFEREKETTNYDANNIDSDNDECTMTKCTIKQYPIWTLLYGVKLIYLGIASYLFHASMKSLGQRLDVAAIYSMVFYWIFLLTFEFMVSYKVDNISTKLKIIVIIMILFDIIIIPTKHYLKPIFYFIMPLFMVTIMILLVIWYLIFGRKQLTTQRLKSSLAMGISGIFMFALGYIIGNTFDTSDGLCSPDSWWQFHALFHCTTAIGNLMMIYMFRWQICNENNVVTDMTDNVL